MTVPETPEMKNALLIFGAATTILFGLGRGFFMCGVSSYCSLLSKPGDSGKNFGILWSTWAISPFLKFGL